MNVTLNENNIVKKIKNFKIMLKLLNLFHFLIFTAWLYDNNITKQNKKIKLKKRISLSHPKVEIVSLCK